PPLPPAYSPSSPASGPERAPARRPVPARRANSPACTTLSTPGGANGTPDAGVNSTTSDTRTAPPKAARASVPRTRYGADTVTRRSEPVEVGLGVRADHGQTGLLGEQLGGHRGDLRLVDGVQTVEHLTDRQVLPEGQLALPEPGHPRPGVLQAQHEPALELSLAARDLIGGEPLGGDPVQLLAD